VIAVATLPSEPRTTPDADVWRDLPSPDLLEDGLLPTDAIDANASEAVWDGSRLVVMDYSRRAAAFDPSTNSWNSLPQLPVNSCEGYPVAAPVTGRVLAHLCGENVIWSPRDDRWQVVSSSGQLDLEWGSIVVGAGDVALMPPYPSGSERYRMYVYRPPETESDANLALDVAAAFGALRADYPFEPGSVPSAIEQEIDTLVSADARAAWEEPSSGLGRFWAYYPRFEVRSVERGPNGTSFEVLVRFTRYSGSDTYDEVLTIAPGTALDGRPHDMIVVGAQPG
jgi:hypothetical protein